MKLEESEDSWVLDISTAKLIKLFPKLRAHIPLTCKCGAKLEARHAEVTKDFIGITSENCHCGVYSASGVYVTRSNRASQKWISYLKDLQSERTKNETGRD